jgi:hypothetical protein
MKPWQVRRRSAEGILARIIAALLLAVFSGGCGAHKQVEQPASAPSQSLAPLPGPEAKIHISYARPNETLSSLVVSKYSTAENLLTVNAKGGQTASIVRFDGGGEVWQIDVDKSLLSDVPVIGADKTYAPSEVKYGSVPSRFLQSVPQGDPPEPLEADHYYIFTVTRASGATSYQAVKVDTDGSLEAYDAEPRAGTSFRLCCNVAPDFTTAASPAASTNDVLPVNP